MKRGRWGRKESRNGGKVNEWSNNGREGGGKTKKGRWGGRDKDEIQNGRKRKFVCV